MTIQEAISQADQLRPNDLDATAKLRWLSAMDGQIFTELLFAHVDAPESFDGYDAQTPQSTDLLVAFPYDELYPRFLAMRIDLENGELERYNNDAAVFNRLWQTMAAHYCRTHTPNGTARLRF
ncbi:MAG: hypothetical protein IIY94_00875 [Oscillospiraceae bacterium]|nr:hypothetical protein [Oscillospiraceae bacterium]